MSVAAPGRLRLRVTVGDTWAPLAMDASPDETVAQLKARALAASRIEPAHAGAYEVKRGGARIADESKTLGTLGVTSGAPLIVLARRRRPVR